jgi:hypothetical protein
MLKKLHLSKLVPNFSFKINNYENNDYQFLQNTG